MVHIHDRNLKDKLLCNVWVNRLLDLRSGTQDSPQSDRQCTLRSHNEIYECCYWMQLRMTNCLMAWCTNPTWLHSLSIWQDRVTITVTTWDLWKNFGLLKPVGFLCCYGRQCCVESDPAGDGLFQSVLLYSTSRHLAVIFISLRVCTGSFIVKRSARWQDPSLSPLCHFTVYASRRLYAINKLSPHPLAVSGTMSVIMLYMQIRADDCPNLTVCLPFVCVHFHYFCPLLEISTVCSSVPWDTIREVDCPIKFRFLHLLCR